MDLEIRKIPWVINCIFQQILSIIIFVIYPKNINGTFTEILMYLTITINILFLWFSSVVSIEKGSLFRKCSIIITLTNLQYLILITQDTNLQTIAILLQPYMLYGYTVEIVNILLYNHIYFKRNLDRLLLIMILLMDVLYFVDIKLYNLLYLFYFIILNIYPTIILLFYKSNIRKLLRQQRRNCILFAVLLLINLFSSFLGDIVITQAKLSNFGWYLMVITLCTVSYFRFIHDRIVIVIRNLFNMYHSSWIIAPLVAYLSYFVLLFKAMGQSRSYLLVIGISNLLLLLLFTFLYFKIVTNTSLQKYDNQTILSKMFVVNSIKNEELVRTELARYLHDDVLQTVIAIKNFVIVGQDSENSKIALDELDSLINNLREEMDRYHPLLFKDMTLKENYNRLISERLEIVKKTVKLIRFECDDNLSLLSPYDIIVYRILKELTNNALKYGVGQVANIHLKNIDDSVIIQSKNSCSEYNKGIILGRGLSIIKETVELLNGQLEIQKKVDFLI